MIIVFLLLFKLVLSLDCCIPVQVIIKTGEWAEEISWETDPESDARSNEVYAWDSEYVHDFCLPPSTTYTFVALDEYGDGWNGGKRTNETIKRKEKKYNTKGYNEGVLLFRNKLVKSMTFQVLI